MAAPVHQGVEKVGSIAITVPDVADADLVFDDVETKTILKFFWPEKGTRINDATVGNGMRRFAQTLLIVAIDATYALGLTKSMLSAIQGPTSTGEALAMLTAKLASKDVRLWFRHATRDQLKKPKIAHAVKQDVARNYVSMAEGYLQGLESKSRLAPIIFVARSVDMMAWS